MTAKKQLYILGNSDRWHIPFRYAMIAELIKNNYTVTVLIQKKDPIIIDALDQLGAKHIHLPYSRKSLNPFAGLKHLLELIRLFKRQGVTHLFTYNPKSVAIGSIAARIAGIPNTYAMLTGLGYAFTESTPSLHKTITRAIVKTLFKIGLRHNKVIFFQNEDDAEFFLKSGLVTKSQITRTYGSGIDLDAFPFTPEYPENPTFLLIARLLKDKGICEYAEAARMLSQKYPNARFLLAGPLDPENPAAINKTTLESWTHLEYLGPLEDVRPSIQSSSVSVLPSYREGTPRSILEGMAMGRPVITTDAPGCKDTVEPGMSGFLVPPQTVEELTAAMEHFILHPEDIPKMGRASRARAASLYDVKTVNQTILQKIQETERL